MPGKAAATAFRMECCPEVNHSSDWHWQGCLHFCDQLRQVSFAFAEQGTGEQNFSRHPIAEDPQHFMADIWAQPIERQNDIFLSGKDVMETFLIRQMDGHQFFIP